MTACSCAPTCIYVLFYHLLLSTTGMWYAVDDQILKPTMKMILQYSVHNNPLKQTKKLKLWHSEK
jgi:hypothetical protein